MRVSSVSQRRPRKRPTPRTPPSFPLPSRGLILAPGVLLPTALAGVLGWCLFTEPKVGSLHVFPNRPEPALEQLAVQTHVSFGLELLPSRDGAEKAGASPALDLSGLPEQGALA